MASRTDTAKPIRSSVKTNPTNELRNKLNYYYRSQDRLTSPRNSLTIKEESPVKTDGAVITVGYKSAAEKMANM